MVAALRHDRFLWIAILFISLLRLVFIPLMGMMPQDAYYFFYSEHLSLSYFDHPPAIAWMLRIFTAVFGQHVFALKLADSVVTALTVVMFYQLSGLFLSGARRLKALLLIVSTLMVSVLSMVSTPDIPLLLMWTIALRLLYHAIFDGRKWCWIGGGVFMGLAFDSKYTAVLLPVGLFIFLALSKPHRRWLLSGWYWMAMCCFLIMILPVVIWNMRNGFASFRFQSASRMQAASHGIAFHPLDFLGVVGHQAALLLPVLFFFLLLLCWKTARRLLTRWEKVSAKQLFLLSFFAPVFFGFFLLSPIYWIKLNWMMPAYITGLIWVSIYFPWKWLRAQYWIAVTVHIALAVEVLCYVVPVRSDDTWVGWKTLSRGMQALTDQYPDHFVFSADDYKTSAVLNFYLKEDVYGENILHRPALQFDFIGTELDDLAGRNAFFVDSNNNGDRPVPDTVYYPAALRKYFKGIRAVKRIPVLYNGRVVRTFMVYECMGYRPRG